MDIQEIIDNLDKLPLVGDILNDNNQLNNEFNYFFSSFFDLNIHLYIARYEILEICLGNNSSGIPLVDVFLSNTSNPLSKFDKKDIIHSINPSRVSNSIQTNVFNDFSIEFLSKFKILVDIEKSPKLDGHRILRNIDLISEWEKVIINDIYSTPEIDARITIPYQTPIKPRFCYQEEN